MVQFHFIKMIFSTKEISKDDVKETDTRNGINDSLNDKNFAANLLSDQLKLRYQVS